MDLANVIWHRPPGRCHMFCIVVQRYLMENSNPDASRLQTGQRRDHSDSFFSPSAWSTFCGMCFFFWFQTTHLTVSPHVRASIVASGVTWFMTSFSSLQSELCLTLPVVWEQSENSKLNLIFGHFDSCLLPNPIEHFFCTFLFLNWSVLGFFFFKSKSAKSKSF